MFANFGTGIRLRTGSNPFFSIFKSPQNPPPVVINLSQTLTLAMATLSAPDNRRPTCPSCSRPTSFCLCTRLKTPVLENSIAVTVIQHSVEKKHPLNSAKIAKLGLKNVDVICVSDVLSEAHFDLHFSESNSEMGPRDSVENSKKTEHLPPADISFTIEKKGAITSLVNNWDQNQDFNQLLVAIDGVRNGFTVKKTQRGRDQIYMEEFVIEVPPGSLLLFPSENSIGIEDVNFSVKNLIVLDGTWPKATKMYKENPWLKLLPHLKLDIDKLSLYGEVRRQPKAGCLSSIESIVYALKAIGGEDLEGLDCLLDVFESMVVDQRRCKDERLKFESEIRSM
ncbi:uncharacterized protein LOC111897381 [Lactuca sativa]|uniref:tRNA-uridine aminocarboxypropyltransferase n=1 Tax=Lactuca sativa TaxID=4236 RepID=A0A9R1XFL0_LACSA|nr:uncharacterized protein LOC111897381 [Lactuca sativa]KAJ0206192.1 hypothetical protein LSAT_V11C500230240 [Lactuca sativa]